MNFNRELIEYIDVAKSNFGNINVERKRRLTYLAKLIDETRNEDKEVLLTFICTHNSRRSIMGQIWAKTIAYYSGIENINTFSGGTEVTAFNEKAVEAIKRAGFIVEKQSATDNPVYQVFYSIHAEPLLCFSKKYDDKRNPQYDFLAIMTCTDAEEKCPFISGANHRISLPYEDPKQADGTGLESKVYDERCLQVATEMCYLFQKIKNIP
ncbi:MAG: protein-tyrosine-phosphatase [Bacteroidota bacterium]